MADVGLLHEVEALVNSQQRAQNITLWLQQSNYEMVSLMTVRRQFDSLIEVYPSFHYHLAANANIVHNKTFESAVCKTQNGELITVQERVLMTRFLREPELEEIETPAQAAARLLAYNALNAVQKINYDAAIDVKKARYAWNPLSKYRCLNHLSVTSVIVERLFSQAKLIMTDNRCSLFPCNLEVLLYLKFNSKFWTLNTVDECVRKYKIKTAENNNEIIEPVAIDQYNLEMLLALQ